MNTKPQPPIPDGSVYLGLGGTFNIVYDHGCTSFAGWSLTAQGEYLYGRWRGGDDKGHYAAPADSLIAKANAKPTDAPHLVWCAERGEPTKMHLNLASADTEARRLAALHPAKKFYVTQLVATYVGEVTVKKT